MFFNSLDFAIFLPLVFAGYWLLGSKRVKIQNMLLLVASYVFYAWWDWRFLVLIFASTSIDYFVGLALKWEGDKIKRKLLLFVSIAANIGMLGFFKYFNFFVDNFTSAFSFFGASIEADSLDIILPVGISFYTFQTLSYTVDVYKRKFTPTSNFIDFSAFVSFFPQLVAGPIERAKDLLPQFSKSRVFNFHQARDGMRQILWGLFMKVVIADNCGVIVNEIFSNSQELSGSTLLLGTFLFSFQIYGDFAGYSNIAIGTSRLFGFNLKQNFSFPYFSSSIAEFWSKWHMSLTGWFKEYLYIPLGGNRGGLLKTLRNVGIVFLVSGFWHGAKWTFIVWGAINALLFIPSLYGVKRLKDDSKSGLIEIIKRPIRILLTFSLITLSWVFFRADSINQAALIFGEIFSTTSLTLPTILPKTVLLLIVVFAVIEWVGKGKSHALEGIGRLETPIRWMCYLLIFATLFFFSNSTQTFIYFQF